MKSPVLSIRNPNSISGHPVTGKIAYWPVLVFVVLATAIIGFINYKTSHFLPTGHDEISYLFQARTFLLGRVTNPPHPERLFFDAYHIINEGIYASKYFPGFAFTLMPFVWLGWPYLNPILFHGIHLFLIFLIGRELFGKKVAWLAMIVSAFSPQIIIHTFMLMSHPACTVFLMLFLLACIKLDKETGNRWIFLGGFAWGFAFLIRPMTAVGFALPVALYLFVRLVRGRFAKPVQFLFFWAIPLLATFLIWCGYNKAVTGSYFKDPFTLYAEIHAPYHQYGFFTWDKFKDKADGPRVDKEFNERYHNHTPLDGAIISVARLKFWVDWIFGDRGFAVVGLVIWIVSLIRRERWNLLIFSIWVSLQLIYFPHWYPGLVPIGSNYLYEVSSLTILCIVKASLDILAQHDSKTWQRVFLGIAVLVYSSVSTLFLFESKSLVTDGKLLQLWVQKKLQESNIQKAVIFVRYAPGHILDFDLINNVPTLDSSIIFARDRGEENVKLRSYFKDHSFYLFEEQTGNIQLLPY